jgi:hypothetical protein
MADSLRNELSEELRKGGYVEGQNLVFEIRSADESSISFLNSRQSWLVSRSM